MDDDTRADLRWIRREMAAEAERIKDKQYCNNCHEYRKPFDEPICSKCQSAVKKEFRKALQKFKPAELEFIDEYTEGDAISSFARIDTYMRIDNTHKLFEK